MAFRIQIRGRSRVEVGAGNHATILTQLNSLHDDIAAGDASLGTYLLERKESTVTLNAQAEFQSVAVFTTYAHADMQDFLKSVFGGVAVDATATVVNEDTGTIRMQASRVESTVTWHLFEEPTESSEALS